MEQFVFSDIFDTKGIEYIIVIFFLLLIIPVWRILNRPVKQPAGIREALKTITLQSLRVPQGILFNKNHTWSHLEKSGVVSVGMDDLLLHLTGGIELKYMKEQQEKVKRGDPIAKITQNGKELVITSPISGEIDKVHVSLEEGSGTIIDDPYGSWLYRIRPEKWQEETHNALMAEGANQWITKELTRFKDYMAGVVSESVDGEPVLQAGGELINHPLMEMDREAWKDFQEKFLNLEG